MTKQRGLFALVTLAFLFAGSQRVAAAEPAQKDIEQNDKVRVYQTTYHPGDVSPSQKRSMRVVHVLEGGTLERTYADGTKETIVWKNGETRIASDERPYAVKNTGKTSVRLLIVALK